MRLPKRKNIRLKDYDYSQNGAYFVTVCTKDRKQLLWRVGADLCVRPQDEIKKLSSVYENVSVAKSAMPNHVHMILEINQAGGGGAPPLQNVVRRFKTYTAKAYVEISNSATATLWQRSFYEHIIRGGQDYNEIWSYIDTNPLKWAEDKYYDESQE